ncbi:MAG: hypothetical protein ACD_58C00319G0001 [uncultured bacterium]|nr:MAG: hypothetical protein ACD_58C00319G0001 [uncultured bacterium]
MKTSTCWCKAIMALLVVVFAWWQVDWAQWALTVLGALLFFMLAFGVCCCKKDTCFQAKVEEKK